MRDPAKEPGTCGNGLVGNERQIEKKFLNEGRPQTSSSIATVNQRRSWGLWPIIRSRLNRSSRRRQPHYVWGYFDVTTESTASPRRKSKFQTNCLKLKITIFFSFLIFPNFWKSITVDEKNPTLRPLFHYENVKIK